MNGEEKFKRCKKRRFCMIIGTVAKECPYCGLTKIDCGKHGYKTPKEIRYLQALEDIKEYAEELGDNLCNLSYLRIKILEKCEVIDD